MGDFDFDIDLLISLLEARPVLWDKTNDIYKDRNETKTTWRKVCICLQEDFEALGGVQKNAFGEYCHNLLNTADCSSYKIFFLILCTILFIFLTSARKELQHLLEDNQLHHFLYCSLLTSHVLIVHQAHLQDQSLPKRLQTYNHFSREQKCAEQHRP